MKRGPLKAAAFSLAEVSFALGLAAFCLIAIFSLLPVGLKSNQMAAEQTAATGILSAVAADLRATPPTVPPGQATASPQFRIPVPQSPLDAAPPAFTLYFTANGAASAGLQADSRYLLSAVYVPNAPSGGAVRTATVIRLQVSWPAAAASKDAAGSVQTLVALDRN